MLCLEMQPVTFSGNSYIQWHIVTPLDRRLYFSLELRTAQRTSRLLHAAGVEDYLILEVSNFIVMFMYGFDVSNFLICELNWWSNVVYFYMVTLNAARKIGYILLI